MPLHFRWLRVISASLAIAAAGGAAAQATRSPCATANPDVILRESLSSKAAQERLKDEFAPKMATLEPLASERNRTERLWLDARQAHRPDEEVNALQAQYDRAAAAEREAARPLKQALDRRKNEELRALIKRINAVYKRLGTEQGFKLLLQEGEAEAAYVLDRSARRSDCKDAVDLTSQIIEAIDKPR
jgi:Skp family chaperone for outer membrane proteins